MRILIIHDAIGDAHRADEADTLAQSQAIEASLRRNGHVAEVLAVGLDLGPLAERLAAGGIDAVFNSMESLGGHARLLASAPLLVESTGVPVVGCRPEAIHLTSNKPWAKSLLVAAGLPTPAWCSLDELGAGRAVTGASLGEKAILKSVWEHSSVGLDDGSVVPRGNASDAEFAMLLRASLATRRAALGGDGFAEAFIEGREIVVGLMPARGQGASRASGLPSAGSAAPSSGWGEPMALPACEIVFTDWPADRPRLVGFAAKWNEDAPEYSTTVPTFEFAPQDGPLLRRLTELAKACWTLLDLRGHARVDFRIDRAGQPWILEVNANPCLTPGAGFSRMLEHAGVAYDEAIEWLVQAAAAETAARRTAPASQDAPQPAWNEVPSAAPTAAPRNDRHGRSLGRGETMRTAPRHGDIAAVESLVAATGFFNAEEVRVAGELVQEAFEGGPAAGYEFVLADGPAGELLGYACFGRIPLTTAAWDLYWIVVSPRAQGRGLGRALLRAVDARILEHDGTHLYAETSGREQYAPTRAFYERCGFELVACMSDFYASGDDKLVYRRRPRER